MKIFSIILFSFILLTIAEVVCAREKLNVPSHKSELTEKLLLTSEEKSWIKAHSAITLSITDDISPRSFIDKDGKIKGTTVDYVRLFEKKLGLKINLVGSDWATALKLALDHEVDGILQAAELEERKPYLNFTQVYSYTPMAVIAGEDEPTISGPDALCGRRVGVLKDSSQSHYLMKHFPCINVVHFKALEQVAYALAGGEIHAVFGNYDYYANNLKQAGLVGFKAIYIEYLPPMGFARIGLRNDEPLLLSIFDKAIAAITDDERARITNRWLGLKLPSVPADLRVQVNLTPEEQAWLAQDHTVRVRVENFPPFMFLEEDKIKGIVIDYLNLIAQRTGLTFEFSLETRHWQEALKSLKNLQGPDLMTSLSPIDEHEPYMVFSEPYMASAWVIFTRTDGEFVSTIDDLKGRTLAVPYGTLMHKLIEVEYPDIGLLVYDTDVESIEAVSTGKADAYLGNLINASYEILQRGFANLKVAAPSPFGDDVRTFGIRGDWPELSSIINKGLDSFTSEEKAAIRSKHLKMKYEYGIKPSDILKRVLMVAGSASLILLLFLLWNRSLKKQVQARTNELTVEVYERIQVEEALTKSELKYRELIDNSLVGVFTVDMAGQFIFVNDALVQMYDFDSTEQMEQSTTLTIWADLKEREQMLEILKKQGRVDNIEAETITHTGRRIYVLFSARLFDGYISGMVMDITERKLSEQKIQVYQHRLKSLGVQLTLAEEQERRRIAAELHDNIGQSLVFSRMQLASLRNQTSNEKSVKLIDELSQSLLHIIQDTKELLFELSSPLLNEIGLSAAISYWINEQIVRKHGLEVEFIDHSAKSSTNKEMNLILFRNIRELLINVVKHAHAKKVIIRFENDSDNSDDLDNLIITVQDDGIGFNFDPEAKMLKPKTGFGLFSIYERMDDVGGSLQIESETGKGCKAILTAPLNI